MRGREEAMRLGAKCEECPLREARSYVPSIGPDQAKVAFVGEAPGLQEALKGQPFIGPSGKLLNQVSSHHGISREEVFLTNACLCRPANNDTPPKSAVQACRPRLVSELEARGVETVVALGNTASQALLGKEGVMKLRVGPGHDSPFLPDVRIIPTVHPAACLRQSDMFPSLVTDIGKINLKDIGFITPTYKVFEDAGEAISVLKELERLAGPLVLDIEVDIDKETDFDHPDRYDLLCVGLSWEYGKAIVLAYDVCHDLKVLEQLHRTLQSSKIVAQNGKFDLAGMYPLIGALSLWFDPMLAHYCLDERPGIHSLDHMAIEYLGAPPWKREIDKYKGPRDGYGVIPKEVLYKYNAYDASCEFGLYELLSKRLDERGLRSLHDFLCSASSDLLMFLELNGIAVDKEYNGQLMATYLETIDKIEDELQTILEEVTGPRTRLNPRSPKQVMEAFTELHISAESTNAAVLENIMYVLRNNPEDVRYRFAEALLRHRSEAKMYGTYIKGIRKRLYKGRVYSTYMLHSTTSGRLSSRNPNLQNIPRASVIRKQFVPVKSDRVFLNGDYAQAELRILTWLAQDEYFRDIFNSGRDLFDELTPVLYPKLGSKDSVDLAVWKETRIRVKAYVYGLAYGREAYSIANEFRITEAEAQRGMNAFFEVIPDIVQFRENIQRQVLRGQDLVTPFGRHRRFHLITRENKKEVLKEALSFLPQSTASDVCLRAGVRMRPKLKGIGYIRNLVHDSIMVEAHESDIEEVSHIMKQYMLESARELVGDYVDFGVDITIGKNWGEL